MIEWEDLQQTFSGAYERACWTIFQKTLRSIICLRTKSMQDLAPYFKLLQKKFIYMWIGLNNFQVLFSVQKNSSI